MSEVKGAVLSAYITNELKFMAVLKERISDVLFVRTYCFASTYSYFRNGCQSYCLLLLEARSHNAICCDNL